MARHLSPEELLRYLDSELTKPAARKASQHLGACQTCAAELGTLREQLANISEAEVTVLGPSLPPPLVPWPGIESRLDAVERAQNLPFWQKLVSSLGSVLRTPLAYGSAALVLVLIALLVWMPVAQVSAHEVIQRATFADTQRLAITPQEVVRQLVRVKKTERNGRGTQTARLESWKSTKSTYWDAGAESSNAELLNRYKAYGLASELPLSPPALKSWLQLAGSEPSASRDRGEIEIKVAANAEGRARGLEEFSFLVGTRDWHVDEMTLGFEDAIFQIDEENSSILDRREVPPDVLARLEPPEPMSAATHAGGLSSHATAAVNLDDLEMTVRYDLHRIGADLGENIEIAARPPGELAVNASGASSGTKEKLAELLANKAGVRLELEPRAAVANPSPVTTIPHTMAEPPDQRIMAFFGDAAAEENFARSALQASTGILAHLYALKELSNRWPAGRDGNLSTTAKAQLAAMLRDHADAIQAGASQLKPQVDFLLKGFGSPAAGEIRAVSATTWQDASASALKAARDTDHVLRSLLTSSDTPMSPDEGLPKLRQSVQDLERFLHELSASVR